MQKIRSASGLPSTVYWVVSIVMGLVRTQRLQNSPPRILRRRLLREQDQLRPPQHCRLPPPEFPPTVHRMAEGNLLRRAPLIHHVVCSKVVRVRLSSGLSDPGLRGRFTPFPHPPLQPVSSRRCSPRLAKEICRLSCSQA